jgi:PhnB protein
MDVFLIFDGNCREALEFYSEVFNQKPQQIMTYGQSPQSSELDKERIIYACIPIFGSNVMFSDCPSHFHLIKGNNIALTIGISDEQEIQRIYQRLSEQGTVQMKLGKTFFSELFGMVTDRFNVLWQISKTPEQK